MRSLLLIFFLTVFVSGDAQFWTPLSVGNSADVIDISFPSDDTGFVSLSNGTIRKTVNGGLNWNTIPVPAPYGGPLEFISGSVGMILSDSGILRTANSGATWTLIFQNTNVLWRDLFFVNGSTGYACGPSMQSNDSVYVYRTVDAGVTWVPCTIFHDWGAQVPYLYFRTPLEGYLFGCDTVHRTSDGGLTWTGVYAEPGGAYVSTISAPDATTAYCTDMVTMEIVKSINGGVTWTPTGEIMGQPAWASHFLNASTGFMAGGNGFSSGYIAQTTDGGASWTTPYIGGVYFWCMDFPSNYTGYCGGAGGVVMKYSDPMSTPESSPSLISCYPNPAVDFLIIENVSVGSEIIITNSLGQIVISEREVTGSIKLNVSALKPGIYLLIINQDGILEEKQVIIE